MQEFKIGLSRTYVVTIKAESEEAAKRGAENFIPAKGAERFSIFQTDDGKIEIIETELTTNEAFSI